MASSGPLHGVRVWLSGAVPEDATEPQKVAIRDFVGRFAAEIFRAGGHILHGSHPTFTPILLEKAHGHIWSGGRKDCLTLAVSKRWSKDSSKVPVQRWRETCMVYETPEAVGESAREDSLMILRQWMVERCDSFIAVGGMWWKDVSGVAGVPIEAELAMDRGLPSFLLGGFGGTAKSYVEMHPHVFGNMKNGLDESFNRKLAIEENIGSLVEQIRDQLSRLPLVRGRVSDGISFRILALDGGGVKGAFTASALATLEESLGVKVVDYFDIIAGTSTGGILAIGLGMGLTGRQLLDFYRDRGATIFPVTRLHQKLSRKMRHLVHTKYSQDALLKELKSALYPNDQTKVMAESRCRLVIPAYDAVGGLCHVFRTPHHPLLKNDEYTPAADVALATAAAPTFFSAATVRNRIANASYFDGGVWANCPAMAAIIEAVCYLDVPIERIDILNIGTTEEPFTVRRMGRKGVLRWNKTLIDLLMNAQMSSSIDHAERLVSKSRFLRVNTITTPNMYTLDGASEIEELITLGHRKASDPDTLYQVKSRFMNGVEVINWGSQKPLIEKVHLAGIQHDKPKTFAGFGADVVSGIEWKSFVAAMSLVLVFIVLLWLMSR